MAALEAPPGAYATIWFENTRIVRSVQLDQALHGNLCPEVVKICFLAIERISTIDTMFVLAYFPLSRHLYHCENNLLNENSVDNFR